MKRYGPKIISFGHVDQDHDFVRHSALGAREEIEARIHWVAYPENRRITYHWLSPSGTLYNEESVQFAEWITSVARLPAPRPLEAGNWRLTVFDDGRPLISRSFRVLKEAQNPGLEP